MIVNIFRSYFNLSKRGGIIKEYEDQLESEKTRQEELKRKLVQVQSFDYIEKEARNKLNLGKDGEIVLLLPSISISPKPTPTPFLDEANWMKWVKLFWK